MDVIDEVYYGFHAVIEGIQDKYDQFLAYGDPRTKHLFGANSPWFIISLLGSYLLFVTKIGPRLMKSREPFELRKVLIVYNLFITLLNLYIAVKVYLGGWWRYNLFCEPAVYNTAPEELIMIEASYLYFISKFIELLDTVFFVLRKKNRQLSFLHIFHHTIMPINVYSGMKLIATGHVTFFGFLNSMIHVPMYLYYMLAAVGPSVHKYLWWKKYLTTLQLIQFVLVLLHSVSGIFGQCDTRIANPLLYALVANSVIFILLFSNFYVRNYLNRGKIKVGTHTKIEKTAANRIHLTNGHTSSSNGHTLVTNGHAASNGKAGQKSPSRSVTSRFEKLRTVH